MSDNIVVRQIARDDNFAEWRVLIHKDILEAAEKDASFLNLITLKRQMTDDNNLRAMYTITAFMEFVWMNRSVGEVSNETS